MSDYIDADNSADLVLEEPVSEVEPNSEAYKAKKEEQQRKKHTRSTDYTITKKQKTFSQKLKEAVFGEDVKNVPEHVFFNIIVPNVVKMFGDSVQGALSMTFRSLTGRRRDGRDDDSPYRNYDYSRQYREERRRTSTSANPDFSNYVFSSSDGVFDKIDIFEGILDEYEYLTVSDVKSELGETPRGNDRKWGWKSVRDFDAEPDGDGWILVTPRAKYLGD